MFDGIFDQDPDEPGEITLVMEGIHGKSFMVLDKRSGYQALVAAEELVAQSIAVDANGGLDKRQIGMHLLDWIDDQSRHLESLASDLYDHDRIKFEEAAIVLEKQLEIMHEEEVDGRRMTFQVAGDRCWSVSKNSSLQELEAAKRLFEKELDSVQSSKLEGFIANAQKERQVEDWMEAPIELKSLGGTSVHKHEIRKDMHPDQLSAFMVKRWKDLSNDEGDKIAAWIEKSELMKEDHSNRIRVFRSGLFNPEDSIEVDLSKHDIDYVENLYKLKSQGAGMLDEHARRLDRFYEELREVSPERRAMLRHEKGLEVPTQELDKVVLVNQFMDRETLITVAENYRDFLSKGSKAELYSYIENADEVLDPKNTVRVYSFPNADYKIVSKEDMGAVARVCDQLEEPGNGLFVSQRDYLLANGWVLDNFAPEVQVERSLAEFDLVGPGPASPEAFQFMVGFLKEEKQALSKVAESAETYVADGGKKPEPRVDFVESREAGRSAAPNPPTDMSPPDMSPPTSEPAAPSPSTSTSPSPSPSASSSASKQLDKQDLEKLEKVFEDLYSTLGQLLNKKEPERNRDLFDRNI